MGTHGSGDGKARGTTTSRRRFISAAGTTAAGVLLADGRRAQAAAGHNKHPRPTCLARASKTLKEFVTGGDGRKVKHWRASDPNNPQKYSHIHTNKISYVSVCLDPSKKLVYSASFDGSVGISTLGTGVDAGQYDGHKDCGAEVWAVEPSPDGNFVVSGTNAGDIHLWDGSAFNKLDGIEGDGDPVGALAFIPYAAKPSDGWRFLAGQGHGHMVMYEIQTNNNNKLALVGQPFKSGNADPINTIAITPVSPAQKSLAVAAGRDGVARIWDLSTYTSPPSAATVPTIQLDENMVWRVAVWQEDPADITTLKIAAVSEGGLVQLFDSNAKLYTDNGMPAKPASVKEPRGGVMGVAFFDKNTVMYTAGDDNMPEVIAWDISSFTKHGS